VFCESRTVIVSTRLGANHCACGRTATGRAASESRAQARSLSLSTLDSARLPAGVRIGHIPRSAQKGASVSSAKRIKEEAHQLVDGLDDAATWDDLMYQIYVRQSIEAGLADSAAGRTVSVEQVRAHFGLPR
jgi:hypothetical protein